MRALSSDEFEDGQHDDTFTCLTPHDRLARSPRIVVDSENETAKLIWLGNTEGFDTHNGCMGLYSLNWDYKRGANMNSRTIIVDIIHIPEHDDAFPGLFVSQLPSEPFVSADGKYLFATSQWRSITKVVKISIATGDVQPISFNLRDNFETIGSQTLLCMTNTGDAVVIQTEPNSPPILGIIPSASLLVPGGNLVRSEIVAKFSPVAATSSYAPKCILKENKLSYHIIRTYPKHGNVKAPVEGILLLPPSAEQESVPLIVVPHGGPHSCTPTSYIPSYAFLCQRGNFGILHANYRGSTGFGQAALESQSGNIGDQDVKDVVHLTKQVLQDFKGQIDSARVGICGGSHGGFLAGHLTGQNSELFKVACMRNPVTNIATMTTATDIPDWAYVEALGPGNYNWTSFRGPGKSDLSTMWEVSPIAHIENITAPTLVAIGISDKRVPPSQGIEYYHALRSKGVETKLLLYENDDHAIDKVQSEADHWINILDWFVTKFAKIK
uniref:acylaminoacyl-peptidase n=1 Tax=Corethron hystrix TaxID=216773 RepID=A0A7S1BNY9_9STRA|mmetsp:Transcript_33837/g.78137  ORF Transcript_33837/g.78137 Transcript_33837/m.78137 type:complete len:497 (+) Transcript_33837:184-1674(+)